MKTRARSNRVVCILLVLSVFAVSGCDDGQKSQPAQQPAPTQTGAPVGQKPAGDAAKQPVDTAKIVNPEQLMQGVAYTAASKRDPFSSLAVKPSTEQKPGVGSLEGFDPGEFLLIAVLWDKSGGYAVLTLPDGKSYTVRHGTKVGLHGGKVVKIANDSVTIREMVKNYKGVLASKDTVLKLRRGDQQ
ncbi:MAG TPA: pilus assembly protein PilP [Dissulfurispiraceae bacterium]|nr:pilus assembly protein PilP [Dissulfurispiraceae bacterium]